MNSQEIQQSKAIWKMIAPVLLRQYKRDKTFLDYTTPWELLVAVILSAQTTDELVNKVTPGFFALYNTPQKIVDAPRKDIEAALSRVNFYRVKSGYIQKSAEHLIKEYNGVVPLDINALQTFSGAGRKTAVAVLTNLDDTAHGIPVDTHVIRFVKRFGLTKATDASKIEQDLLQIILKKDWKRAGYAIKEYGRKEGKARGYKAEIDPLMIVLKNKKTAEAD